jgi:hypothetical protein
MIQIKGYSNVTLNVTRTNDTSGGGVSLYIRENFPFEIQTDLQHRSIECLWITIRPINGSPGTYRELQLSQYCIHTPSISSTNMDEFNDYFCFCIDNLVSKNVTGKVLVRPIFKFRIGSITVLVSYFNTVYILCKCA